MACSLIDNNNPQRRCPMRAVLWLALFPAMLGDASIAAQRALVDVAAETTRAQLAMLDLKMLGLRSSTRGLKTEYVEARAAVAVSGTTNLQVHRAERQPRTGRGWRIFTDDPPEPFAAVAERGQASGVPANGLAPPISVVMAKGGQWAEEVRMPSGPLIVQHESTSLPAIGDERLAQDKSATEPKPTSLEELFKTDAPPAEPAADPTPDSADALFGMEPEQAKPVFRVEGFFQNELAYTYPSPGHWSKIKNILELGTDGRWGEHTQWKLSGRVTYDPIYDLSDFYNDDVRDDQVFEADFRETYVDISAGDWDFRFGRQHIIWGEVVGLFVADVVSALDLREFVLPDFDMLRTPQWAARAEYFRGDFHTEAIWIPYMTYNKIGKPGAEFYSFPPPPPTGFDFIILDRERPANTLENSAYGARASYLYSGWDVAAFYYGSMDAMPSFERRIVEDPTPAYVYRPGHERIDQVGVTIAKDLGRAILNGEAVYTWDRLFSVTRPSEPDGRVPQDFLDYLVGLEFSLPQDARFNVQFFQRRFADHDPDIIPDDVESGFTLYLSKQLNADTEPEILFVRSLNRNDWMLQAKVTWRFRDNWRFVTGVDVFEGPPLRLFGQFDQSDRVYTELRYSF